MKSKRLPLAGLLVAGALLAACSNGQGSLVPSNPTAQAPARAQAAVRTGNPAAVSVAFDDVAAGRSFHSLGAHVTYPSIKNPFAKLVVSDTAPVGYPLDVTKGPGPTVSGIAAYNIYVNCPAKNESCWGHPEEFLKGLTGSAFAGMITQYTGGPASAYTYGDSLSVSYSHPYSNTYYNEDLFSILATAVKHFKQLGLGAEYHIFLPSGTDTCFDQYSACYSPDNLAAFAFCAYHSAAVYDKQPILYTVEPYQNATIKYKGQRAYPCQNQKVPAGTNRLDSGTASTLSHESFETWSDPEPNTGWFNARYGAEIGDICAYAYMDTVPLGSSSWYIQQEYSNAVHGCASQ